MTPVVLCGSRGSGKALKLVLPLVEFFFFVKKKKIPSGV